MPGVLSAKHPKVISNIKEFGTWEGKNKLIRPLKRMPSGDATKSLSENATVGQIRQHSTLWWIWDSSLKK